MMIRYMVRYMIADFLIEQKDRILKLEEELKATESKDRKKLIQSQIGVYFQQGLEAMTRFESNTPKAVKDYFLGYRKDAPTFKELTWDGEMPPEGCPRCKSLLKEIPAGISKNTGRAYKKFWVCDNPLCDYTYNARKRNTPKLRRKQDRNIVYISIAIAIGVMTVLYLFSVI